MIWFVDDKWAVEQMKRDRLKGILLRSFEHLSPVWLPEGIGSVKELEMELHISRDLVAKLDAAS